MHKAFYIPLLLITLVSCTHTAQQPGNRKPAKPASDPQHFLKQVKTIYQGVWIKDDYFRKVKATQSILAAVDLVKGITGMKIDSARLTGESMPVSVGWDNHNPGEVILKLKPGRNFQSLQFGDDELGYAIRNGDTTLLFFQVYKGVLYKTPYRKISATSPDENVSDVINLAVNKALISGTYTVINVKGIVQPVKFFADGTVTGLANFSRYFIENDLEFKPLNNLDLVTFDVFTNRQQAYSYVFKNDTLKLYEVKPDTKGSLMVLGKLKYLLKKVKQ